MHVNVYKGGRGLPKVYIESDSLRQLSSMFRCCVVCALHMRASWIFVLSRLRQGQGLTQFTDIHVE